MAKILALTHNELIKISKRVSIIVILSIMLVGILLLCGGMRVLQYFENEVSTQYPGFSADRDIDSQIESYENEEKKLLQELERLGDDDYAETDRTQLSIQLSYTRTELFTLRYMKEKGLVNYNDYYASYMSEVINTLAAAEAYYGDPKYAPTEEELASLRQIYESGSYHDWIDYRKTQLIDEYSDAEEYRIMQDILELRYTADPQGEHVNDVLQQTTSQIADYRIALLHNLDSQTKTLLSAEKRAELENKVAVLTYKVEQGMTTSECSGGMADTAITVMTGFATFMIVLLVIILAGGSISQELSSGSVKSLIISPTRRWKIYTAKLLTLITVGVGAVLLMYIVSSLAYLIFFGSSALTPYVYAVDGVAHTLNFFLYRLAAAFVSYLDILVFTFFAFMLSVITRNTAASVGVSMGVYFGGNLLTSFLLLAAQFNIGGRWMQFIPSMNLNLQAVFFPFSEANDTMALLGTSLPAPSLTFSLCYLLVVSVCMLLTAFDSFTKRDI